MKHCRYCNNPQPESKAHLDVCHRGPCKLAHRKWCAANWDLMEPDNKFRQKYEDAFWEVNDTQRQQFSRFFELMKPISSNQKARKCLRCRGLVSNRNNNTLNDYRLCGSCRQAIVDHYGKLAEMA